MIISRVQVTSWVDNLFELRQYKTIYADELNQSSYFFGCARPRDKRKRMNMMK